MTEKTVTALAAPNDTDLPEHRLGQLAFLRRAADHLHIALTHVWSEIEELEAGSRPTKADHTISGITVAHIAEATALLMARSESLRNWAPFEIRLANAAAGYSMVFGGPFDKGNLPVAPAGVA